MNEFFDAESCAPWYVVIRAVENFRAKHGKYPGMAEDELEKDFV